MKSAAEELPTGFVGRSLRIVQIRGLIERIGPSRTRVLIQGESGTGKEAAGRSREDPVHRLNVTRLTMPPLRERKDDIPLLIERLLAAAPARYILAHETMQAMMSYDWPGNIRGLRSCLERMVALNSAPTLN